jgi:aminoglycoside 2''-phosphotransferase
MDITAYLARIFREFPEFANATIRVPVQGMDHVALILDEQWIWRFPVRREYLETFTREAALLNYLYDKKVTPIPQYVHFAKDRTFGAYTMLRGEECTERFFVDLPPAAKVTLARELALFLSKLHAIRPRDVLQFGLESPTPDTATELRNDYTTSIASRISKDEQVACQTFFTNYARKLPYPTETLIHGDFS